MRHHGTYRKILLSYSILTIIMTLLIGTAASFLFSVSYRKEMDRMDQQLMDQISNNMQLKVFSRAVTLSNELMLGASSQTITQPFYAKVQSTDLLHSYQQIYKILSQNSDTVADINIYYADINLVVSAVNKVKYLDTRKETDDVHAFVTGIAENLSGTRFITVEPDSALRANSLVQRDTCVLYVAPYYRDLDGGFLVIQLKAEALRQIILEFYGNREADFWVIAPDSRPAVQLGRTEWSEVQETFCQMPSEGSCEMTCCSSGTSILSAQAIAGTGYSFVKAESSSRLYAQIPQNVMILMLVCGLALLVGLAVSLLFSRYFYDPVRNLLQDACASLEEASVRFPDGSASEYMYISSLINHAAEELDKMKKKQKENEEQLRQRLTTNILYGACDARRIREEAERLGIPIEFPF